MADNAERTIDERISALILINMELQAGMLRDLDTNSHELTAEVKALTQNVDRVVSLV